ncbi:hypothetical protein [Synechococcus sp. 1G10]|uniref:hypothetical protein n=1 Tax=Synechococcus sp. 1G10 TaxID=2025605 RepID=UPI00117F148A|nr:hypothetical protein [Synechococcus sp. 1G10]
MTITPPDAQIAKHTISAACNGLSETIHLLLYFNGCNPSLQAEVLAHAPSSHFIFHKTNWPILSSSTPEILSQIGKAIESDIFYEFREGFYETCGEVWSRELRIMRNYAYVGLLDADCEILDKTLLAEMAHSLDRNKVAAVVSTSFAPTQYIYEPYSGEYCYLMERFQTWCCLYRSSALSLYSSFSYYEDRSGPVVKKYDHSSYLQHELKSKGYVGIALESKDCWRYLHYGQFAKNKSLHGYRLELYRLIRIGRHNGFAHVFSFRLLTKMLLRLSNLLYKVLGLQRFDAERMRYITLEEGARLGYWSENPGE